MVSKVDEKLGVDYKKLKTRSSYTWAFLSILVDE